MTIRQINYHKHVHCLSSPIRASGNELGRRFEHFEAGDEHCEAVPTYAGTVRFMARGRHQPARLFSARGGLDNVSKVREEGRSRVIYDFKVCEQIIS